MKLGPIADKWGSDKCRFHSYGPIYDEMLEHRQNEVRKVLEIGIGFAGLMTNEYRNGASLFMWAEYFPNAEIYGLDIRYDALVNEGRIHSMQCDQGNAESLEAARYWMNEERFDLIVDDGSHEPDHQKLTASILYNCLAPGGVYVIEDVRNPADMVGLPFIYKVVDLNLRRAFDDRMVISL